MTACPACGGPLRAWRRVPENEPGLRATWLLSRCSECGSAVTIGDPPGAAAHEAGAYRPGAPRLSRLAAPLLHAFDRRRLALLAGAPREASAGSGLRRAPRSGRSAARAGAGAAPRLLDVGAGRGRFVAHARAAGWDARGIEPSRRSSAQWVEPVGIEDARVEPESLDAITLWHVLEHVEDPAEALARLRGWLKPGGALLVGVPNLDSVQARVGGPYWYHLDLPRHRTHFTARGIAELLQRSGFEVLHTEHVLLEHNPFGMWQSAVSRMTPTPSWLYHALKRNAPLRAADGLPTLLALPLIPGALLAERLAAGAGRGGTVAVLTRRG